MGVILADIFNVLRNAFRNDERYWEDVPSRECGFSWPIENCAELSRENLRAEFNKMMGRVIVRWRELGGLQNLPH